MKQTASAVHFSIFSIVGTTSVGKSEAVFSLANYCMEQNISEGVDILSADSRQVYEGLEILTGADVPSGFQATETEELSLSKYFSHKNIRIFGLSLTKVNQEWSVGEFQKYAHEVIALSRKQNRILFVVGGTGLYHEHLLTSDPQFYVPPNEAVRAKSATMELEKLQEWLWDISPSRFSRMNHSDLYNSRRLIRAIEMAMVYPEAGTTTESSAEPDSALAQSVHIFFGLQTTPDNLLEKITTRVHTRFEGGAVDQVRQVLAEKIQLTPQAETALGFKQIVKYLAGEITKEQCIAEWIQADFNYSKRQITWWKKHGEVTWFDTGESDWQKKLLQAFLEKLSLPI